MSTLPKHVRDSPIRLCRKCNDWKPQGVFTPTGRVCRPCRSRIGRKKGEKGALKFYREAAIPGTEAHEKAKQVLGEMMEPKVIRGYGYRRPDGTRPHRRPPRFSHLPAKTRAEAERILQGLMIKHADKLAERGGLYLGSLVAISSRLAQLKVAGKSLPHYNAGRYAFKRHLMIQLGLMEKPVREPVREPQNG